MQMVVVGGTPIWKVLTMKKSGAMKCGKEWAPSHLGVLSGTNYFAFSSEVCQSCSSYILSFNFRTWCFGQPVINGKKMTGVILNRVFSWMTRLIRIYILKEWLSCLIIQVLFTCI